METTNFKNFDDLIRMLDRERQLLRDLFERRKSLSYRLDYALEIVDYKRSRIDYLIEHGVFHHSGDFLEMEEVYIRFFEEVLELNDSVSIAGVKESIDQISENIDYFFMETERMRKAQYVLNVRKLLRRIGLRTIKNVIDLKRHVDVAYKQVANIKIKKSQLGNLSKRREEISEIIKQCESLIVNKQTFFKIAASSDLDRTCKDMKNDFTDASHGLLEVERQIIAYLNQIDFQSELTKKIARLKYIKDQHTWKEDTNATEVVKGDLSLWTDSLPQLRTRVSLSRLASDDTLLPIVAKLKLRPNQKSRSRDEAPAIDGSFFSETSQIAAEIDRDKVWNAFLAQGKDLFGFIQSLPDPSSRSIDDNINLFCQLATINIDSLVVSGKFARYNGWEYALIYAK